MKFWIDFWAIFFFASLALFAGLAVVVSIGGFFNIRSLFKSLSERTGQDDDSRAEDA
jgi:hypothetical protein